jgi:hypothetical protein
MTPAQMKARAAELVAKDPCYWTVEEHRCAFELVAAIARGDSGSVDGLRAFAEGLRASSIRLRQRLRIQQLLRRGNSEESRTAY